MTSLFAVLLLGILLLGAITWKVDPYRLYTDPAQQVGAYGTDLFWYARLHKPYALQHLQPDVLILGSSRSARLGPSQLAGPGQTAYNAALPGVSLREIRHFMEHAQSVNPLERVVLGLDYYFFRQDNPNAVTAADRYRKLAPTPAQWLRHLQQVVLDRMNSLLSATALYDSYKTLTGERLGQRDFYPDGTWQANLPEDADGEFAYSFMARFKYREYSAEQVDQLSGDELIKLLDFALAQDIAIDLVISPLHALLLNAVALSGRWEAYLDWQRQLVALVAQHPADARPLGLENSRELLTEKIDAETPLFRDGVHTTAQAGRGIAACLSRSRQRCQAALDPVVLSGANVESYLTQITRIRDDYARQHPRQIKKLKRWVLPTESGK